jgi:3-deoxy-manno-octulosonate cytidylyltransferase (CMP-KDO synthetase)
MNFLGIIPARYASTRLPGKPLVDICGKPMLQWVYEAATKAINTVYVATDDSRIVEAVNAFGGKVVLTRPDHTNGTTRCLEAWEKIKEIEGDRFQAAINIQGDEPLLNPISLHELQNCFADGQTEFATLVLPVVNEADLLNESEVFVTFTKNHEALYFSRSVIPAMRGLQKEQWFEFGTFHKHLGLYAYTYAALQRFAALPISILEQYESLEQLRWLENGGKIKVGITQYDSIPVDTPEDLERVRQMFLNL